jgi:hypothetical protein
MKWRMFGTKGRKTIRKKGLLKSFRLSLASRNGEMNTYSSTLHECNGEAKSFASEAYLLSKKRMCEVEAEKALMVNVSRHPRWVAGGPH